MPGIERKYSRSSLRTQADMIALVDGKGRRLDNSPAYKRVLGYSAAELEETSAFEQIHPDDRCRVLEAAGEKRARPELESGWNTASNIRKEAGGFLRQWPTRFATSLSANALNRSSSTTCFTTCSQDCRIVDCSWIVRRACLCGRDAVRIRSSLCELRQFPVDVLKIDRSLVREMQSDRTSPDMAEVMITWPTR
jgi:PAS domain S-box-containing protein